MSLLNKMMRNALIILMLQAVALPAFSNAKNVGITTSYAANDGLPTSIKSQFKFIGGLMFVEVVINGTKGLLLVDTGSNGFILLNAEYFKTKLTGQTMSGMGGTVPMEEVKVELLEWQNLQLKDRLLPAIKMNQLNTGTVEKVLGLIGSAFFKPYQLTLNFATRELELKKSVGDAAIVKNILPIIKLPFTLVSGFPVVEVNIAGKNLRFVMDTGATDNLIDTSLEAEIAGIWKQTQQVNMTEGSGNGGNVRRGVLDRMTIGGLNMDKIQMGLHTMPAFDKEKAIAGILGFQFLKYFYVDINYIDKTMKFYDMAVVMNQQK
ncbi:pepsin/retropepsin-like aspartic protease family protein [Pedobacter nyackensis]|uniref:pepsin/retropepsin-like aspartic protease family protein n=1 Tax=Pedobacter nyackensis TaxID=475255 RepID=UPI00293071AB|nr:pepsin/retropepsin-like aspartic protease family protein [Pedobacter nyackensis]